MLNVEVDIKGDGNVILFLSSKEFGVTFSFVLDELPTKEALELGMNERFAELIFHYNFQNQPIYAEHVSRIKENAFEKIDEIHAIVNEKMAEFRKENRLRFITGVM